ncbi:uncharacterized protein DSM5745_02917 [Aspergillus mulundensis]|uniref:Uncharacterized protein n=1 Tax=Aspergillus mulundensis TaxID=1810919 RepID=A0A3D8SIW4_9EURO|nr:hypothetical protein DSM5745_02917 [Aspergillus mulundensis]RDW86275.1 hypothetical protein DSM5745_02917 [Aspergillus mulundensis]
MSDASTLIAYCTGPEAELLPISNQGVGLEVRVCTGNSRRVSLWDATKLSRAKYKVISAKYFQALRNHSAGSIEFISTCWTREGHAQIDHVVGKPGDDAFKRASARREVINAILALENTGADHEGWLQAMWPSECPQVCGITPSIRLERANGCEL